MANKYTVSALLIAIVAPHSIPLAEDQPDRSAIPTAEEADNVISKFDNRVWFEVDGKRTVAVPDPEFNFPKVGTEIDGTNLQIGDSVALSGRLLNGRDFTLEFSAKHKATLIVFWSSDCSACLAEFPVEKAFYKKYKDRGFRIVAVNSDANRRRAKRTIDKFGLPWPVIFDGDDGPINKEFAIDSWPTLLLVDHAGKLIHATRTGDGGLRSQRVAPPVVYQMQLTMALTSLFPATADANASAVQVEE